MAKGKPDWTQAKFDRYIKEGRGQDALKASAIASLITYNNSLKPMPIKLSKNCTTFLFVNFSNFRSIVQLYFLLLVLLATK